MEICNMVVCGENVTIRLQDNFIYFAYGNMKLKFDISQNGQGQSQSLQGVLNTLTSNDIGVVIDFGVFEHFFDGIGEGWNEFIALTIDLNPNRFA